MPSSSMVAERPYSRHFFKVMINDFRTKLSIPPGFSIKLNGEKMEKAVLTSYKGSWDVEVGKCGQLFHFKEGWVEFVQNHDLNVGDFVVFEHKGNMRFDVLVFDSSACEKRLSYKSDNKRRRTAKQANSWDHGVKHVKLESDSMVCKRELHGPMVQGNNNSHDHVQQLQAAAASSAARRPFFTTTITPTNCIRGYPYLNIPREFWRSNDIVTRDCSVALRDPLNRWWPVKLRLQSGGSRLSLGCGWYEFYESNELKVGDVCVFELNPTSPETPNPVLDVRTLPPQMVDSPDCSVALRDPLNSWWPVKLRLQSGGSRLSLGCGWYEFYESNELKVGDVCVFELNPTSPETPNPVLDVRTLPPQMVDSP